ncbi:immune inhibitor A domain-containing protein [Terrabacter sp. NPDC000476]|uniref:immune inhibitor A domain-containing protein n=1 Tax=Terrabacter sp. NPDC000476 TaxID=3154258 RepID=UPI00332FC1CF
MTHHSLGGRSRLFALVATSALTVGAFAASPVPAALAASTPSAAPAAGGGSSAVPVVGVHPAAGSGKGVVRSTDDNLRSPLAVRQDALRQRALEARLRGEPAAQGAVVKVGGSAAAAADTATAAPNARSSTSASGSAKGGGKGGHTKGDKGQYVQLEREGTDKIFVVLVEFGDEQYPNPIFQGPPPDGSTTDVTGPRHNEIPAPNRRVDNSTLWQKDFTKAHYENMYFNRMAKYYERQSSGRYSVEGAVTEWVKVPFNEALYGRNYCGSIVCNTSTALVRDALAVWVKGRLDAGQTMEQISAYLKTFDQQDRYDIDGDGNFDEPDGVIDHFQIVHAGGDEAAGDPNQGSDAIWSHRSFAAVQAGGPLGAGVDIGSNSGLVSSSLVPNNPTGVWVGDYTMQPENGGLGVFAHEFGHDLGLPDLYDTSGNTGGAENNTAFWTLMSSGANIGDGGRDGIGDNPTDLGAYELFQLGWLQPQGKKGPFYAVARAGERSWHALGSNVPAQKRTVQAIFTVLPDKQVPLELGDPFEGDRLYYSGAADDLDTTMTKSVTLPSGTVGLSAKVRYNIEEDWDYAYLRVSADGGTTWSQVPTNLSRTTDPNGNNLGQGFTGLQASWTDLTADLTPWAGRTVQLQFRYKMDAAQVGNPGVSAPPPGLQVDAVAVTGQPLDGAESDTGWTFDPSDGSGFRASTGTVERAFFNAYIAENRQYDGYDRSLRTAYNFGFPKRPDWVESYRYQNGMLVNYWDGSQSDNNVGDHPGSGLVLPVDAHPQFSHWSDGTLMRNRILSYDSTFGLEKTDAITLHNPADGSKGRIASKKAVPAFDDTRTWWFDQDRHGATGAHPGRYQPGWYSVDVPKTGTVIRVVKSHQKGGVLTVLVTPKR